MPTPTELRTTVAGALKRVLAHADPSGQALPDDLGELIRHLRHVKGERGRKALAEALGLVEGELALLDASVREVERTVAPPAETDPHAERNAVLAQMRLLSWLETIGQRVPALALEPAIDAAVSEDLGRKQVRAVELIVRSLITESYGDQDALIARLRQALNERVVDKWQGQADAGDILSGCTFSELASLFVNKQEFSRYESLYEGTPFLTLLRERRRTIHSFLDDMRRIRNVLAHNKKVSNVQLSLLDLYYEEIVTPVQTAHDHGETQIDPDQHLDASTEELERYTAGLREDVHAVRDDLAELSASIMTSLGGLEETTARIEATTSGINRTLLLVGGGVLALLGLVFFLVGQGSETQDGVDATRAATERTEAEARKTAADVRDLTDSHKKVADVTKANTEATKEIAAATKDIAKATKESAEDIKGAKDEMAKGTKALEDAAKKAEASTERVVQTLEELRKGFATLTQSGGVIASPRRPQEHYHNARILEQRGDQAGALASYKAYFGFDDLVFVDPHLRFQSFLKLQRGLAGAREVYYDLKKGSDNVAMLFAWNLLLEGDARATGLDALLEAHPKFGPAHYARSRDFSIARLGAQSIADKREEKKHLSAFLALRKDADFLSHYLDQAVASKHIQDAEERLALLDAISDEVLENPVAVSGMPGNSGWTATFSITDTVKEIFYRIGSSGDFKSTGFIPGVRAHHGLPLANPSVNLGKDVKRMTIQVKYTDPRDKEHGPFDLEFDPTTVLVQFIKRTLDITKGSWLTFRDMGEGRILLYFTGLVTSRGAIQEIRYALDKDVPDTVWPLRKSPPTWPSPVTGIDETLREVPATTKFATVQVTFLDGTKTEVVRFNR